jgi:hypothetical protein
MGMLQTARNNVLDILEVRFETVPQSILKRLKEINDPDILKMMLKKALRSSSMDEFRKTMNIITRIGILDSPVYTYSQKEGIIESNAGCRIKSGMTRELTTSQVA